MKRFLLIPFLMLLVALPSAARAQYMPPFVYYDLEKNAQQLDFNTPGQLTFFHFWASWCVPCVRELPRLNTFARLQKNNPKVRVVAISLDRDPAAVSGFFKRHEIDYLSPYIDTNNNAMRLLAIGALPMTIIIDGFGKEIARFQGDYDWPTYNFENGKVARMEQIK